MLNCDPPGKQLQPRERELLFQKQLPTSNEELSWHYQYSLNRAQHLKLGLTKDVKILDNL